MKIVFVIRSLANGGGVERVLTDKANYLLSQGHLVTFITYEQGQHSIYFDVSSKINHIDLDCRLFTLYEYSLFKRLYKAWKMKRRVRVRWNEFVDNYHPDAVVMTTYSSDVMSELMSVYRKTNIIVESHTAFIHDMCPKGFLKQLKAKYLLHILKRCRLLITLTNGDKQCWEKYIRNVRKVVNPVNKYMDDIENVKREKGRIISVGRLHEQKRYDRLINAFALISNRHPSWHVDIYGKGDLRSTLEERISELKLEKRIVIHEPTKNIFQEYLRSEMSVLSSDYEGMPLVLLEAMACGVPSVSTNCPFGPSEVIVDKETGLLCKMEERDLANKIEWMITHERERHDMGVKGHKAVARFKKEIVMKEWEEAYISVLS